MTLPKNLSKNNDSRKMQFSNHDRKNNSKKRKFLGSNLKGSIYAIRCTVYIALHFKIILLIKFSTGLIGSKLESHNSRRTWRLDVLDVLSWRRPS